MRVPEFKQYSDHEGFSARVLDYLLVQETANNILLSMLHDPKVSPVGPSDAADILTCLVEREGRPVFVAARRPGFYLVVAGEADADVVECACEGVAGLSERVEGVIGPRRIVELFADRYTRIYNANVRVEMEQLIYEIRSINPGLKAADGSLRVANPSDTPLLIEWFQRFQIDIGSPRSIESARERVFHMVARKSAYLWMSGDEPVSLATHSRSTRCVAAISGVYTPPKFRNRGYATACVSSLAARLLGSGFKSCCLYTDANYPTSNRIYRRIGFRQVERSIVYRFNEGGFVHEEVR